MKGIKAFLETIYEGYSKPELIEPDPLVFARRYRTAEDREVAGFIAANFALGRVKAIEGFLDDFFISFPSPYRDITSGKGIERWERSGPLYYRFYDAENIRRFLTGISHALNTMGSLKNAFLCGYERDRSVWDGLESLVSLVKCTGSTVPADPSGSSACKRLHLFLRWMVRNDDIDLGVWNGVNPGDLVYPVDTHILKISTEMGITARRSPDRKAACEITSFFRNICPDDPVKYDFCLSRFGIHPGLDYNLFYSMRDRHNRSA